MRRVIGLTLVLVLAGTFASWAREDPSFQTQTWVRLSPWYIPLPGQGTRRFVHDISKDGEWLFYSQDIDSLCYLGCANGSDVSARGLWRVRRDGTDLERVGPPLTSLMSEEARSSADGSRVVFRMGVDDVYFGSSSGSWWDTLLYDFETGTYRNLTHHQGNGYVQTVDISWDGKTVAWQQWGGKGDGIWVWREGSGPAVRVSAPIQVRWLFGLSGDGGLLTFAGSDPSSGWEEVFVVSLPDPLVEVPPPQKISSLGAFVIHRGDMDDLGEHILFGWHDGQKEEERFGVLRTDGTLLWSQPILYWANHLPRISGDGTAGLVLVPNPENPSSLPMLAARVDIRSGALTIVQDGNVFDVGGFTQDLFESGDSFTLSYDGSWMAISASAWPYQDGPVVEHVYVTVPDPPSLTIAGTFQPGDQTSAYLYGRPGARAFLFAAADTTGLHAPGHAPFLLDPSRTVLLASTILDSSGLREIRRIVPEVLPFGGETLYLQAWVSKPGAFTKVVALDVP